MKNNFKIIGWLILFAPTAYFIGIQSESSVFGLLAAMGLGVVSVFLIFWNELMIGRNDTEREMN